MILRLVDEPSASERLATLEPVALSKVVKENNPRIYAGTSYIESTYVYVYVVEYMYIHDRIGIVFCFGLDRARIVSHRLLDETKQDEMEGLVVQFCVII